jgi:hypothetical protein
MHNGRSHPITRPREGKEMILPEESGRFAQIKEGYREWLERARRESDERRVAARRAAPGGGRRMGDPPQRPDRPGDGGMR